MVSGASVPGTIWCCSPLLSAHFEFPVAGSPAKRPWLAAGRLLKSGSGGKVCVNTSHASRACALDQAPSGQCEANLDDAVICSVAGTREVPAGFESHAFQAKPESGRTLRNGLEERTLETCSARGLRCGIAGRWRLLDSGSAGRSMVGKGAVVLVIGIQVVQQPLAMIVQQPVVYLSSLPPCDSCHPHS